MSIHPEPRGKSVTFAPKEQVQLITPRSKSKLDVEHPIRDSFGDVFYPYSQSTIPSIVWIQRTLRDLPELKEYLAEHRAVRFGIGVFLLPHLRYGLWETPSLESVEVWQNFYDPNDLLVYNLSDEERIYLPQQEFNEWCVKTTHAWNNCMAALGYTEFNVTPFKSRQ